MNTSRPDTQPEAAPAETEAVPPLPAATLNEPAAGPVTDVPPLVVLPPPLDTLVARVPRLNTPARFLWRLIERWGKDQCPLIAAAMAFFGLLSVFPLVLAVIAILSKTVAADPKILKQFLSFVAQFFPGAAGGVLKEVQTVATQINSTGVGLFAIGSLLWSGRAYFDTLAAVLNTIWPHATLRTWLQHQLVLWATFIGAGVMWLLSTTATFALSALQVLNERVTAKYLPQLSGAAQSSLWDFAARLMSFVLTTVMFWLIYRFLPNAQPLRRRRIALGAALVASVGWELAKFAFIKFLGNVGRYEKTYGSVAGVVLTMMWIYFASLIILLGAEAAGAYEETVLLTRPGATVEARAEDAALENHETTA